MEPVNSRMSRLKNQIRDQIEDVAKSICEGGNAFEAMQMLESLTSEFIAEKHRLSNNRKPVEDRPALEQMSMPSALHCPNCRGRLYELKDASTLYYRCRSGHAFSAQSLLSIEAHARQVHLSSLLDELIEEATLARNLAIDSSFADDPYTTESLSDRANMLIREANQVSVWLYQSDTRSGFQHS